MPYPLGHEAKVYFWLHRYLYKALQEKMIKSQRPRGVVGEHPTWHPSEPGFNSRRFFYAVGGFARWRETVALVGACDESEGPRW